ncbi:MAG TPA: exodeoxyribonuclease III [Elainellaceae cyanobacterium]
MKVATWNVNSIRTRIEHVVNWLEDNPVDVLCLQETKVVDADFPRSPFAELGYHIYAVGQKSYNGVALLSRAPLEDISAGFAPIVGEAIAADFDEQKRVITGVLNDVRIVNLYVPNGASVGSEKYDYKLRWLQVLRDYLKALLNDSPKLLVCGDFNIALEDKDIHNPEGREAHIMASDPERRALKSVLEIGLTDAFRQFTPDGGHYSWWDYRAASFRRNMGWRIDHHYLSDALSNKAVSCTIDKNPRTIEKPSDHTPVIVELA